MVLTHFNLLKVFQGNGIEVQRLMSILPPTGSWEVRATLLEKSELYAIYNGMLIHTRFRIMIMIRKEMQTRTQ